MGKTPFALRVDSLAPSNDELLEPEVMGPRALSNGFLRLRDCGFCAGFCAGASRSKGLMGTDSFPPLVADDTGEEVTEGVEGV